MDVILKYFIDTILGQGTGDSTKWLTASVKSDYPTLWTYLSGVYSNICFPLGASLLILYFLTAIIDIVNDDLMSGQAIFKLLLKFGASFFMMSNALTLFSYTLELGSVLTSWTKDYTDSVSNSSDLNNIKEQFYQIIEDANIWEQIGLVIPMIIPWLVGWVSSIVVVLTSITRLIELAYKVVLSPIALADGFRNNFTDSTAYRTFKDYLALALQGMIILIICTVCNYFISAELLNMAADISISNVFVQLMPTTAISIAKIGLILKSISVSKALFGLN